MSKICSVYFLRGLGYLLNMQNTSPCQRAWWVMSIFTVKILLLFSCLHLEDNPKSLLSTRSEDFFWSVFCMPGMPLSPEGIATQKISLFTRSLASLRETCHVKPVSWSCSFKYHRLVCRRKTAFPCCLVLCSVHFLASGYRCWYLLFPCENPSFKRWFKFIERNRFWCGILGRCSYLPYSPSVFLPPTPPFMSHVLRYPPPPLKSLLPSTLSPF